MQLDVVRVSQAFGRKRHLDDVSLHIPSGIRLGIIGKSGAGKTTLLRCIAGLVPTCDGQILFDKRPHTTLSRQDWRDLRRRVGFITQGVTLLNQRTVWQNIELALTAHPHLPHHELIEEILSAVQLADKAHAYPDELSGGQRQRVAIARALVHKPELVLCDEFTSALDSQTTDDMLMLLRQLHRPGITFVFVTHDLHVVQAFAQHVVVIDQGVVVEQGSTSQVLTNPQHPVTKSLMRGQQPCPRGLQKFLHNEALLKLVFGPQNAGQPILAEMLRAMSVDVNIVAGSIDALGDDPYGYLFVSCPHTAVPQLVTHLEARGVHVTIEQGDA